MRTWPSGRPPITSGSFPAAAFEVRIWLNWSSATATSLTLTPVFSVKSSTMSWVAATRSGRSSSIQTVMLLASPPPPPLVPTPAARAERGEHGVVSAAAAVARRRR